MKAFLAVVLAIVCTVSPFASALAADAPVPLRHGYTDNRFGQLHYSIAQPVGSSDLPPLVLLHQSPNSSTEFDDLVRALGRERIAIAVDTPGYGGSDGPATIPTIEDYAAAIAEGLKTLGYSGERPVDLFGYHTGSKIATELAITEPRLIRRVMLSGIYDPPAEQLSKALANLHHPTSTIDLFERFSKQLPRMREYYTSKGLTDEQWGRIRIDGLRPQTRQEYGHEAAYRYAPRFAERLAGIPQPVLLLPMDDGLAQATRDAAKFFSQVKVEPETFSGGGFFTQSDRIAQALNRFSRETLHTGATR